ncbi:MAG: hypothetical protein PVJ07_02065 [Anaerolineales bacterium]|jgi:hypothetical protein
MIFQDPLLTLAIILAGVIALGMLAYVIVYYVRDRRRSQEPVAAQQERPSASKSKKPPEAALDEANGPTGGEELAATLLYNEETGALAVCVNDREYHSAASLKRSKDWKDVEGAITNLLSWFSKAEDQEILQSPVPQPVSAETKAEPQSMVDQINLVLEQQAADRKGELADVRLGEGPDGDVQVLIGLESYPMDQVPDAKVRRLIRQAVEAWEAQL